MAELLEMDAASFTTDVTLTTTTETVLVSSPRITIPKDATRIVVWGYGQLTTGAGTTAVTPRIRRGAAITDALVGLATAENVKAAAGSTEAFFLLVAEELGARDSVRYSFTLQQTAATGNGTALQGTIAVFVLSG